MAKCPKCGFERKPGDTECFKCGIIYEKYEVYLIKKQITQKEAAIKQVEKAEVTQEMFDVYMAEALGDHLKTFTEAYPERVLHPEVKRMVKIVETSPEYRTVDKIALRDRLERVTKLPEKYFQNVTDVHAGRMWSFTGIQMAHDRNVTEYMIVAEMDKKTCPVCMRLDGKQFSVSKVYERMIEYLDATDKGADDLASMFPFPRFEDVDNKSPEEISVGNWVPPFHPKCRCDIIMLWSKTSTTISLSGSELPG